MLGYNTFKFNQKTVSDRIKYLFLIGRWRHVLRNTHPWPTLRSASMHTSLTPTDYLAASLTTRECGCLSTATSSGSAHQTDQSSGHLGSLWKGNILWVLLKVAILAKLITNRDYGGQRFFSDIISSVYSQRNFFFLDSALLCEIGMKVCFLYTPL